MKKAQSEVITTVLIILLVLAAVFIVYTAVRSMVTTGTGTAEQKAKCIGLDLEVTGVTVRGTAAVGTVGAVDYVALISAQITVQRNSGGNAEGAIPVILVNRRRVTSSCTSGEAGLTELETATCTLTSTVLATGDEITVGGMYGTIVCEGVSAEFEVLAP